MIVVRIKGGLGNQLFQYSVGYSLSQAIGESLGFNPSFTNNMTPRGYKLPLLLTEGSLVKEDDLSTGIKWLKNKYINKVFRILRIKRIKLRQAMYWLEPENCFDEQLVSERSSTLYLDGYYQDPRYFKQYRKSLLEQIKPMYLPEPEYLDQLSKIQGSNSVAIHVRRTDFKKDGNPYHYLLNESYYKQAIDLVMQKVVDPQFFWFSDDIDWVKACFGDNSHFNFVRLCTQHPDIDEMMLMKNCHHIITANSTFSWWAAWLNEREDAIRIVPKKPYGPEGMIPETWIKIDVE